LQAFFAPAGGMGVKRCRGLALVLLIIMAHPAWASDDSDRFVPGEIVTYKMYWLGLPIAWATTTTDMVTHEGRKLFRIRMVAQTYAAYKHIYEVNDSTEVLIDPETGLPVRHEWIINEGSIHKNQVTDFYHDQKIAIFRDRISRHFKEIDIESDTREIFSFIYTNRNADLAQLAQRTHRLLVTGKVYDLEIKIKGTENISVPGLGDVLSIEVEPVAEFDGIFLRKGKVFFWISAEKRRVITYVKADIAVGHITGKLESVTGDGETFWNRIKE
jgi:hypothetical protein